MIDKEFQCNFFISKEDIEFMAKKTNPKSFFETLEKIFTKELELNKIDPHSVRVKFDHEAMTIKLGCTALEISNAFPNFEKNLCKSLQHAKEFFERYATQEYRDRHDKEYSELKIRAAQAALDFDYPSVSGKEGQGNCFGENHTDNSTKMYLIQHMKERASQGIKKIFVEHLNTEQQHYIDEFLHSVSDEFHPLFQCYLNRQKEHATTSRSLEEKEKKYLRDFDLEALIRTAKKYGVEVIGIDSFTALSSLDKYDPNALVERTLLMNQHAYEVIKKHVKSDEKFDVLVGRMHAHTHEGGIPGLCEMLDIPSYDVSFSLNEYNMPAATLQKTEGNPKNREVCAYIQEAAKGEKGGMTLSDKMKEMSSSKTTNSTSSIDPVNLKTEKENLSRADNILKERQNTRSKSGKGSICIIQ